MAEFISFTPMQKKAALIIVTVVCLLLVATYFFVKALENGLNYKLAVNDNDYREYVIDVGSDNGAGFTSRAFDEIRVAENVLSSGSPASDVSMQYVALTPDDESRNVIEKRLVGNDIYTLRSADGGNISEVYSVYENDRLLFSEPMEYGADGPILDWRVVDGEPAFTYRVSCDSGACVTDIYYEGSIADKFNVQSPRYLFVENGKLGFVATDAGNDKIFFDGYFITPGFDSIHTYNCCSLQEILPTVYANGILLFFAQRGGQNYLAEVSLR